MPPPGRPGAGRPQSAAAITFNVNVAALYAALTRRPTRAEVVPLLVARTYELLTLPTRGMLQGIDGTWQDKVSQIFGGLLQIASQQEIHEMLVKVADDLGGIAARRMRYQIAKALPFNYGATSYDVADAMVKAASEAIKDPDIVSAITPATIVEVFPMNRAVGVPIDTDLRVTFDSDMDPATITAATFLLANPAGARVDGAVSYDVAAKQAILKPAAPLTAGVVYTVWLRGGMSEPAIRDAQAVPLLTDRTWTFTTAAAAAT